MRSNLKSSMPNKRRVIIITPLKVNANNYYKEILKLGSLKSINSFIKFANHTHYLATNFGGCSI